MPTANALMGHREHLEFFEGLFAAGTLPAAILFAGPPMVGKTTLAERLARRLLCETGAACGTCASCRVPLDRHPDLIRTPTGDGGISRESTANLLRRVWEAPVLSRTLVAAIERVDRCSPEAASLLLKTLEDAPRRVRFLLTTDDDLRVPATVRSRCLVRRVQPLTAERLRRELSSRGLTGGTAARLATLSGGRPGLALRLHRSPDLFRQYAAWETALSNLPQTPLADRSSLAEETEEAGTTEDFLRFSHGFARAAVRAIAAGRGDPGAVRTSLRRSREAMVMLRANVPPRLALEYFLFHASRA